MDKQLKQRDKPHFKPFTINSFGKLRELEVRFLHQYKVRYPSFTVLLLIANCYNRTGKGMTIFELSKYLAKRESKSEIVNTGNKIKGLLLDNLIEIGGNGRYGSHVYIPTQRVLKELQAMCDEVNRG